MGRLGEFPKTERFECLRRIGRGSFGTVYEVFDQERGATVAAKVLREEPVGDAVLRFKKEFRGLTELQHPNIVRLYELLNEGGQWFFTMELLPDARSFTQWVRPLDGPWSQMGSDPTVDPTTPLPPPNPGALKEVDEAWLQRPKSLPLLQLDRLRDALKQLAAGIHAIHDANRLHRDIKPNNVLVTAEGRVVLVDFGLATPLGEEHSYGTPAYMAPEQCSDSRLGPAADWYSVGVMLYEALTGVVPYNGLHERLDRVLQLKRTTDPPPPRRLIPELPRDLNDLCLGLMNRDPHERTSELEVLRRLGLEVGHEHKRAESARPRNGVFVGRKDELATLKKAYDDVRQGRSALVLVQGESGVGKSELLRRFVQPLGDQGAVVLVGRCYERESVPYKAWDGVVDHLSEHLAQLPKDVGATLVPRHTALLLNAFPVLRRVEPLVRAPVGQHHNLQPHEQRARVFEAFRELLGRVADRTPLVIVIDDLQWADHDSIELLSALMQPPGAPPVLMLASVRENADSAIRDRLARIPGALPLRLPALDAANAEKLVRLLADATDETTKLDVASIAAEAAGHPMFIEELVRHVRDGVELAPRLRLEDALSDRIHRLPEGTRRVVEALAVAGRPISRELGARALDMSVATFVAEVESLQLANLVRTDGTRRTDMIEPYHDRVREAVLAKLDSVNRRGLHEQLAVAFETSGQADAEALAIHWHGAGDLLKAARFAVAAGDEAFDALAFDRAARLYRRAVELWPESPDAISVWSRLGEALVNAGRGAAAAEVLSEAARRAEPEVAVGLRQRAAEQLLRSGHVDAGLELLAPLLAEHGLAMPESRGGAVATLLKQRAALWFGRKSENHLDTLAAKTDLSTKKRIDLCWSTMQGIFNVDQLLGMVYHARHLRLARQAADPVALARSLAMEAIYLTANGNPRATVDRSLERAAELAARVRQPYIDSYLHVARGVVAFLGGSWKEALEQCRLADEGFRQGCIGATWESDSAQQIIRWALCYLGRLPELEEHVTKGMRDARERNDLYASMSARSGFPNLAWLVRDDVDGARHESSEAIGRWSQSGFHLQHVFDLCASTQIDLYVDEGAAAHERLTARWKEMDGAGLLRVQLNRVTMLELRARSALARAKKMPSEATALVREAQAIARRLHGEGRPWADALGALVQAQTVKPSESAASLEEAAAKLEAVGMALYAKAARSGLSATTRTAVEAELREMGVVAPARLLRIFTPML
jgi:hypothetical protein